MGLLACRVPEASKEARSLDAELRSTCIGYVSNNAIWIAKPGGDSTKYALPSSAGFSTGVVSADGRTVVGSNNRGVSILDLETGRVQLLARVKPASEVSVSADAMRIAWVGNDSVTGRSGAMILDRKADTVQVFADDGRRVVISPAGELVAVETDTRIRVFRGGREVRSVDGTLAAWWDDQTLSYRSGEKQFTLAPIGGGSDSRIAAAGRVKSGLHRSLTNGNSMYAARTDTDYWRAPSSCPELHRVVVRRAGSGAEVAYHFGCTFWPHRYQWIPNAAICTSGQGAQDD